MKSWEREDRCDWSNAKNAQEQEAANGLEICGTLDKC